MSRTAARSEAWSEPVESPPGVSVGVSRSRSVMISGDRSSSGLNAWILGLLGMIAVLALAIIAIVLLQEDKPVATRDTQIDTWLREIRAARTPEQRTQAISKLVDRGPQAVMDVLDQTIKVGEDRVGITDDIITDLSMLPESRLLPILDTAITNPRTNVRIGAAVIAKNMGPRAKSLAARLVEAAKDENKWVRIYALDAIIAMGPDASPIVGQLIILFHHKDSLTQRRALEAVGKIGPLARMTRPDLPKILKSISSDSKNSNELRGYARSALQQIGDPSDL